MLNLGQRVVAVGERGSILLSDDQGVSWQSASVASQRNATLTAVVALDDKRLLAVGHDGWILRSTDDGSSWQEGKVIRHKKARTRRAFSLVSFHLAML